MATSANPTRDDFAAMLDEQLGGADDGGFEGRVVKGTVTAIENGMAQAPEAPGIGIDWDIAEIDRRAVGEFTMSLGEGV